MLVVRQSVGAQGTRERRLTSLQVGLRGLDSDAEELYAKFLELLLPVLVEYPEVSGTQEHP